MRQRWPLRSLVRHSFSTTPSFATVTEGQQAYRLRFLSLPQTPLCTSLSYKYMHALTRHPLLHSARRRRSRWTLAVILTLLLFSLIELVGHLVYYLIQFPAGFGTSAEDISDILSRLVILNVVAERVNVRGQFTYSALASLIFFSVCPERRYCNLAGMGSVVGLPRRQGRLAGVHVRKPR